MVLLFCVGGRVVVWKSSEKSLFVCLSVADWLNEMNEYNNSNSTTVQISYKKALSSSEGYHMAGCSLFSCCFSLKLTFHQGGKRACTKYKGNHSFYSVEINACWTVRFMTFYCCLHVLLQNGRFRFSINACGIIVCKNRKSERGRK